MEPLSQSQLIPLERETVRAQGMALQCVIEFSNLIKSTGDLIHIQLHSVTGSCALLHRGIRRDKHLLFSCTDFCIDHMQSAGCAWAAGENSIQVAA